MSRIREFVSFGSMVYSGSGVTVYRGQYQNLDVAIKVLLISAELPLSAVKNEVEMMELLRHKNICSLIDWDADENYAFIVTEWMEKDLQKVVNERAQQNQPWSSRELWCYFIQLIDAFAYAQEQCIAHRDVKPANIFLNSYREIKIGDFGTSKKMIFDSAHSMVGSPYFLSPEMKNKYLKIMKGQDDNSPYKPFQADVFSLGLTFLFMIQMRISPKLADLGTLESAIANEIANLPKEFQPLLSEMLKIENRMDFVMLQDWLGGMTTNFINDVCEQCGCFRALSMPSRLPEGMRPQFFCSTRCRANYYWVYQQAAYNGILLRFTLI